MARKKSPAQKIASGTTRMSETKHKTINDKELTLLKENKKKPLKKPAKKSTTAKKSPAKKSPAKKRPLKTELVEIDDLHYPFDLCYRNPEIIEKQELARTYFDCFMINYDDSLIFQPVDQIAVANLCWMLVQISDFRMQALKEPFVDKKNGNNNDVQSVMSSALIAQLQMNRAINASLKILAQAPSMRALMITAGAAIQQSQANHTSAQPKQGEQSFEDQYDDITG